MKTVIEIIASPEERTRLDRLATRLLGAEPETRDAVARMVVEEGFSAYKGGRHVAVLRSAADCAGSAGAWAPRVALITHTTPDFN